MSAKKKRIKTNPKRNSPSEHNAKHSLGEQVFALPLLQSGLMGNTSFSRLSSTSQTFYSLAKPELKLRAVTHKLLKHVLLGEQAEACAMIKANPKLLLIKAEAKDYSGRTIIATPFQAAIGAGDKPMWKMMLPYFEGVPGEALRQFHEWFPKGIIDTPALELQPNYNTIALAIIHDKDHGQSTIEAFRINISAQKEIRQGNHFNLQHFIAAYQAYLDNFDALGTWYNRDLFWNQVIGYVQRQITTYDAQFHCSGVEWVLYEKNRFFRKLRLYTGGKFFPLREGAGLGFEFGCYSWYYGMSRCAGGGEAWDWPADLALADLKKYVEQKQTHLQDLESHLSEESVISPSNCS